VRLIIQFLFETCAALYFSTYIIVLIYTIPKYLIPIKLLFPLLFKITNYLLCIFIPQYYRFDWQPTFKHQCLFFSKQLQTKITMQQEKYNHEIQISLCFSKYIQICI